MTILKLLATFMSLAIACLGVLGLAAPNVLLEMGRSLLAPSSLYWVAAVRIIFGGLLILVAAESRFPRVVRVIGILILVAGLLTPLFGTELMHEVLAWFSALAPALVRAIAVLPLFLGLFTVYAINGPRRVDA
jgi:membrane protein HdeD